jgi:putative hydrolase of the HAD superfamily
MVNDDHIEPALPFPRAVGFDLGDTLIEYEGVRQDWQHRYPEALAAIAAACGHSPSEEQSQAAVGVLLSANTRVTPRAEEMDYRQIFGRVIVALGFDPGSPTGCPDGFSGLVERATDAFFSVFRRRLHAMPGAVELLGELDRLGIPLWILTDVPYGMPRRLTLQDLEAAGLSSLASVTTSSVEVGRRKPAPDGLLLIARRLGVQPETMWYVGNERRDVAGAKAAGMTAVLLWRDEEPAPEWGQDLVVKTLQELRARLRAGAGAPRRQEL